MTENNNSKPSILIPELESCIEYITDKEIELQRLINNKKDIPETLVTEVFCTGFRSRPSAKVIRAFYYMIDAYRGKRTKKDMYYRDEGKPKEIHPSRSALLLKKVGATPLEIVVEFLHDLPEDLAQTPEEMQYMLEDIEKKFGYIESVNVHALQNKHRLLAKHLERKGIGGAEGIRKELNIFTRAQGDMQLFGPPAESLLYVLKQVESGKDPILEKLMERTYPQHIWNSQIYLKRVCEKQEEKGKGFSLSTTPKVKKAERIDNTLSMHPRTAGKKLDLLSRNCNVIDWHIKNAERGLTDPGDDRLNKILIYASLRETNEEIKDFRNGLNKMTEKECGELVKRYDLIYSKYGRLIYSGKNDK